MPLRIGLMGFGRISRNIFRQLAGRDDLRIVAISDLGDPESMAYLLTYDTLYRKFPGPVALQGRYLVAGGHRARLLRGGRPEDMPWDVVGADVVVEATHAFRRGADLEGHLASGARRVLLTTPALDAIDRTIVHGVNHTSLVASDRIISCASATTHVLGLMLRILDDAAGIRRAMMTSVHAYSSDQKLSDAVAENPRRSRSAAENLIPNWSWSPAVVAGMMPHLAGLIDGMAVNVPVPNGSNVDLTAQLREPLGGAQVNEIVRQAAEGPYQRWLEYATEPLVSSDVIGSTKSAVFDSLATMGQKGLVKTVAWFDNGWGYAARIIETLETIARFDKEEPR
ncbi:MAG: type I glyceraldehyde-3-phosphate dehydrogenase [Candidatus Polarisedimenticolia bacterium]